MNEHVAAIGLGSNLDEPELQIRSAIDRISEHPECALSHASSLYMSAPLAGMDQPDYVNAVVFVKTTLEATDLLRILQSIETDMGRERDGVRWAARTIDLDLLTFDQQQISSTELTVPHPGIAARNFVLLPLQEICADLQVPGLGRIGDVPVNYSSPRIRRVRASDDGSQ